MNHDSAMQQCENQILRFFRYLDERQYGHLVSLLAADAAWHRQGKILRGGAEVLAALQQRSPTMKIVHIITNVIIDRCDAQHCALYAYMVVVRHEPGLDTDAPCPLENIDTIRSIAIRMRLEGEQWKITEIKPGNVIFAVNA